MARKGPRENDVLMLLGGLSLLRWIKTTGSRLHLYAGELSQRRHPRVHTIRSKAWSQLMLGALQDLGAAGAERRQVQHLQSLQMSAIGMPSASGQGLPGGLLSSGAARIAAIGDCTCVARTPRRGHICIMLMTQAGLLKGLFD